MLYASWLDSDQWCWRIVVRENKQNVSYRRVKRYVFASFVEYVIQHRLFTITRNVKTQRSKSHTRCLTLSKMPLDPRAAGNALYVRQVTRAPLNAPVITSCNSRRDASGMNYAAEAESTTNAALIAVILLETNE